MVMIRKPVQRSENLVDLSDPGVGARRGQSAARAAAERARIQFERHLKELAENRVRRLRQEQRRGR